jgi:hypothetical protein
MSNLKNALQQLREERQQVQVQAEKLDSAIAVLQELVGRNSSGVVRSTTQPQRVVSAASRRKMAQAQRARWAKARQQSQSARSGKTIPVGIAKRRLSASARHKIAAAQRARWARVKAQQAKKAA